MQSQACVQVCPGKKHIISIMGLSNSMQYTVSSHTVLYDPLRSAIQLVKEHLRGEKQMQGPVHMVLQKDIIPFVILGHVQQLLLATSCLHEKESRSKIAKQCDVILWAVCCHAYYTITSSVHATTKVACTVCMHAELFCKQNTTDMPLKPELLTTAMEVVCKHAKQSKPYDCRLALMVVALCAR